MWRGALVQQGWSRVRRSRRPAVHRSKSSARSGICRVSWRACAALLLALFPAAVAASCSAMTVMVAVPVTAYVPASCGDAGGAAVTLTGLGDFAQTSPAAETVKLGSNDFTLASLPPTTREIVMTPLGDGGWAGSAFVPDAGAVEVLTLPQGRACPLSSSVGLANDPGASVGMVDATHVLFVGGIPPFQIDLSAGSVTQLSTVLNREYATITPFGAGALIAGGEVNDQAQNTAVVYSSPVAGSFGQPILLPTGQRQQHAAVALADGRVLLVGGMTDTRNAVLGIDVFDPAKPAQPVPAAGSLMTGRVSPTAFVLPNGQVFVGGGFDPMTGAPVASAEWLAPDLTWLGAQPLCSAAGEQGFAPTEGGAVLAVMGEAATASCSNVTLVLPSGVEQAPPIAPAPTLVRLFTGAQASPVLLTDTGASRWNPWSAVFTPLGAGAAGLSLPTGTTIAATTGLALWLGTDDNVWLLRFDTHGEYATDVAHGPYLLTDDEFTAPGQLAGPDASVSFSPATATTLSNGATVWLTDATFAAVTASVTLPVGGAATLVLRDPSGNEVTCTATGVPARGALTVVRSGASVTMSVGDAGASAACDGTLDADVRVSIGLVGPPPDGGVSTVQALSVTR